MTTPPGGPGTTGSGDTIRPARPADVEVIQAMVVELAEYERSAEQAQMSVQQLREALFGPAPALFGHLAVDGDDTPVGFALWFLNFSTWSGVHGIYLEDLYVRPGARGAGHGVRLLQTLAALCVQRGYGRLEWWVLNWNQPALDFYRAAGAVGMDEWTVHRLTGPALAEFSARGMPPAPRG